MLEVKNISSGYGKKQVLFDVSFTVGDNEVVLLTGGNGSGKSTVLKCIYGLLPLWLNKNSTSSLGNPKGSIIFNGADLARIPTSEMVKHGIVYIPQKNNYFESLTVEENLDVSGSIYPKKICEQRKQEIYKLPYLYEYRKRTPFNLSGGERGLLALSIGLMHKPKLILFDEPFAGLDKVNANIIFDEIRNLKQNLIGMLIVEHKMSLNEFCDRKSTLYLGKIKHN
jgi:branched-chain amino acid transport system ATP-binding protein